MITRNLLIGTAISIMCCGMALQAQSQDKKVEQSLAPNSPVGEARGIIPGRVVWSHAPGAASWKGGSDMWFDDKNTSQEACDWMIAETLMGITGERTVKDAWNAIFTHYNRTNGRGDVGYVPGQKIAVKINNNNTASHQDSREINATPQMVLALIRSMVDEGGIRQEDITIAEPSRFITDYLYKKCHNLYPNVNYVDNQGGDGRIKVEFVPGAMKYSADNGNLATGIAKPFVDADYVINMALLKGHVGQGVTLCGKNWYGCMSIDPDWRKNFHNNFDQDRSGKPKYLTFVDFMGHKDLGAKTVLCLIDGVYGCRNVGGEPMPQWNMTPFSGAWPSSLLGSLDPVAVDMVANDLLINEFPDAPEVDYSDMYLMEAAQAANPPSGTVYDPDGDGTPLKSLGVAEHWNNAKDKKYSRNLGTGKGIELVYRKR